MAGITKASNELGELEGEAMSARARRGAGLMALLMTVFIGASFADASLQSPEDGLEPSTGDEQPVWDVDAPAFSAESKTVPIDVRSGTWMNLDVSPSGEQIVFDLLGDLYLLPIEGGQATSITSGRSLWKSPARLQSVANRDRPADRIRSAHPRVKRPNSSKSQNAHQSGQFSIPQKRPAHPRPKPVAHHPCSAQGHPQVTEAMRPRTRRR